MKILLYYEMLLFENVFVNRVFLITLILVHFI
jgi:hypothetical protein